MGLCQGDYTRTAPKIEGERASCGLTRPITRPRVDMPKLIDLYMNKKLKLDELVTRTYSLEEVNEAFVAMEKGEVARSVVVM